MGFKLYRKKRTYLILFLFFICSLLGVNTVFSQRIYVGVYQNSPKIFIDDSGNPSGIFIELIEEIAAKENWELE
ncbi:MAG: hypothetical protein ACP5D6_07425 [Kosmotogaceae bacterium]